MLDDASIILWVLKGTEIGKSYESSINNMKKNIEEPESEIVLMIQLD